MERLINEIIDYNGDIVYFTASIYHILLSLILIRRSKSERKSKIIMFSQKHTYKSMFVEFGERLESYGIESTILEPFNRIETLIGVSEKRVLKKLRIDLGLNIDRYFLVNYSWNYYYTFFPASVMFDKCDKSVYIEEGARQYVTEQLSRREARMKTLLLGHKNFWEQDKLITIYVQHDEKCPDYLKSKITKFDINGFVNKKDEDNSYILNFFLKNEDIKQIKKMKNEKCGIILTQHLVDLGLTEDEQRNLYKDIMKYYSKYGKVYLKIHPYDHVEYKYDDYSDFEIVNSNYPSEIYTFYGIDFEYAVGISTSAIEMINAKYIINLNENFEQDKKVSMVAL